jgi:hypothetical protein
VNLNDERKPILPTSVMLDNTPQDDEDEYVGEDEEEEYDDLELEKAQNLLYGGAGEYIYRRSKDPDDPDQGAADPYAPITDIKKRLDDLYADLEELDTNHDQLELRFND